eukprot:g11813.t1
MPNGGGVAEESGRGWRLAGSTPLSPGRTPLSPRAKTNDNGANSPVEERLAEAELDAQQTQAWTGALLRKEIANAEADAEARRKAVSSEPASGPGGQTRGRRGGGRITPSLASASAGETAGRGGRKTKRGTYPVPGDEGCGEAGDTTGGGGVPCQVCYDGGAVEKRVGKESTYLYVSRVFEAIRDQKDGSESAWPGASFKGWNPDENEKVRLLVLVYLLAGGDFLPTMSGLGFERIDSGGRSGCSSRVNGGSSCRGFRCIDSSGSSPPRIGRGRFCSADGGRLAGERPRRIPGWLSDASDTSDVGCDIRSDARLGMSTEGVSDEAERAPGDD